MTPSVKSDDSVSFSHIGTEIFCNITKWSTLTIVIILNYLG